MGQGRCKWQNVDLLTRRKGINPLSDLPPISPPKYVRYLCTYCEGLGHRGSFDPVRITKPCIFPRITLTLTLSFQGTSSLQISVRAPNCGVPVALIRDRIAWHRHAPAGALKVLARNCPEQESTTYTSITHRVPLNDMECVDELHFPIVEGQKFLVSTSARFGNEVLFVPAASLQFPNPFIPIMSVLLLSRFVTGFHPALSQSRKTFRTPMASTSTTP